LKTFYRKDYQDFRPDLGSDQVGEFNYDKILRSPILVELQKLAEEYFDNSSFSITQMDGKTSTGKPVEFSSYSYPDAKTARFCAAIFKLSDESQRRCQTHYTNGITEALQQKKRVDTQCRFGECMTCCVTQPLVVDDKVSGYYRYRSLKLKDGVAADFSSIATSIKEEAPAINEQSFKEDYVEIPEVDATFFTQFHSHVKRSIEFLIKLDGAEKIESFKVVPDENETLWESFIQVTSGTLWRMAANMSDYKNRHLFFFGPTDSALASDDD